jgi:hypothetical protein
MTQTNKVKTLSLNGKDVVVNFGINYFYRYFLEATGVDLIANGLVDIGTVKVFDYLAAFIYAGHKAECSFNRQKCELPFEDCQHEVLSMSEVEATKLLTECFTLLSGKTEDEEKNVKAQAGRKVKAEA